MTPRQPLVIAIIEDDTIFRNSFVEMIKLNTDMAMAGAYGTVNSFLKELPFLDADLFWVDINLPDGTGIELLKEIKKQKPQALCLICTLHNDDQHVFDALKAGANGYILKNTGIDKMMESIDDILAGGAPMSPYIATRVIQSFQKNGPDGMSELSERENEILGGLSKGFLYKEIALQCSISKETVKRHIASIYKKLHVQNRTEAVLKYLQK